MQLSNQAIFVANKSMPGADFFYTLNKDKVIIVKSKLTVCVPAVFVIDNCFWSSLLDVPKNFN